MPPEGREHILIVEDDARLAELTAEYLAEHGMRVSHEADGSQAVQRILNEKPDLVVLDVMLPGEDGISICRRLRPRYDGLVLMLTARTDEMDQVLALEIGADDYVCKPVAPALAVSADSRLVASPAGRGERSGAEHAPVIWPLSARCGSA